MLRPGSAEPGSAAVWMLANDIAEASRYLDRVGPYPTLAVVSLAVLLLAYLSRAAENYVRHLHKKPYLPYSNPRFILTVIGGVLIADGFLIGFFFEGRLELHVATLTLSGGLLCLILSGVLSVIVRVRDVRRTRAASGGKGRSESAAGDGPSDGAPPQSD